MNIPKKTGSTNCGLYTIANLTALTLGNFDPTSVVFNQNELRSHYLECLEKNMSKIFLFLKHHHITAKFSNLNPLVI